MVFLHGCSSSIETNETAENFSIQANTELTLPEGLAEGVNIAVSVTRVDGHTTPITLSIDGVEASDSALILMSARSELRQRTVWKQRALLLQ